MLTRVFLWSLLFLKSELPLVKMQRNENICAYLSRVKELRDKLGNIGENESSNDLVIVTKNEMLSKYQVFITNLTAREKVPYFDDLTGILM